MRKDDYWNSKIPNSASNLFSKRNLLNPIFRRFFHASRERWAPDHSEERRKAASQGSLQNQGRNELTEKRGIFLVCRWTSRRSEMRRRSRWAALERRRPSAARRTNCSSTPPKLVRRGKWMSDDWRGRIAGYGGLSVSVQGPSKAELRCKEVKAGLIKVLYKPTEPGVYAVSVKFADHHVSNSPFTVNCTGKGLGRVQQQFSRKAEQVRISVVEKTHWYSWKQRVF